MKNNDKAYIWSCSDFSDEEAKIEMLAARFQTVESNLPQIHAHYIDAKLFKDAIDAAKKFNQLVKEEKFDDLVYAAVVEDLEEQADPDDDPDKNKTADAEGEGNWLLSN